MTSRHSLAAALRRAGIGFQVVEDGRFWMMVAPALGARIIGAGIGEESAFWAPPEVSLRGWDRGGNAGGQRTWIAPETGPRGFFCGTDVSLWSVPPALDPGAYRSVDAGPGRLAFRSSLTARASDGASFPIAITRSMAIAGHTADASAETLRIAFSHEIANLGSSKIDGRVAPWSILQLPCDEAGTIIIPLREGSPASGIHPCFEEPPHGTLRIVGSTALLSAVGGVKYKLGVTARAAAGTIAFARRLLKTADGGHPWLFVAMRFAVDPRAPYIDMPPMGPADAGDAVQAYCDPGTGDLAFCEIEAHAPAPVLAPGQAQGFDIEIIAARASDGGIGEIVSREVSAGAAEALIRK